MCMLDDFLIEPSTRITAEIQRNIIKQGKRNPISQRYHAKDDKEAIATWRLRLDRVRHIFNVRSVTSALPSLTVRLQTELGMITHTTLSSAHQDSVKKNTITTDIHRDTSDAEVTIPRVRNDVSNAYRKGGDSRNQAVSTTRTLPSCDWCSSLSRLTPGQQPRLRPNPPSNISVQCARRIESATAATEKHA